MDRNEHCHYPDEIPQEGLVMARKPRRATVKMDKEFVYLEIDDQELQLSPIEARKLGEAMFQTACSVDAKNPPKAPEKK